MELFVLSTVSFGQMCSHADGVVCLEYCEFWPTVQPDVQPHPQENRTERGSEATRCVSSQRLVEYKISSNNEGQLVLGQVVRGTGDPRTTCLEGGKFKVPSNDRGTKISRTKIRTVTVQQPLMKVCHLLHRKWARSAAIYSVAEVSISCRSQHQLHGTIKEINCEYYRKLARKQQSDIQRTEDTA